ncbi:unnamed protein product [Amoebophrya sp. A120]|nr:unnamed protein product [Amoebophrya sp. A120]|eukprot:GSA120T00001686001.1
MGAGSSVALQGHRLPATGGRAPTSASAFDWDVLPASRQRDMYDGMLEPKLAITHDQEATAVLREKARATAGYFQESSFPILFVGNDFQSEIAAFRAKREAVAGSLLRSRTHSHSSEGVISGSGASSNNCATGSSSAFSSSATGRATSTQSGSRSTPDDQSAYRSTAAMLDHDRPQVVLPQLDVGLSAEKSDDLRQQNPAPTMRDLEKILLEKVARMIYKLGKAGYCRLVVTTETTGTLRSTIEALSGCKNHVLELHGNENNFFEFCPNDECEKYMQCRQVRMTRRYQAAQVDPPATLGGQPLPAMGGTNVVNPYSVDGVPAPPATTATGPTTTGRQNTDSGGELSEVPAARPDDRGLLFSPPQAPETRASGHVQSPVAAPNNSTGGSHGLRDMVSRVWRRSPLAQIIAGGRFAAPECVETQRLRLASMTSTSNSKSVTLLEKLRLIPGGNRVDLTIPENHELHWQTSGDNLFLPLSVPSASSKHLHSYSSKDADAGARTCQPCDYCTVSEHLNARLNQRIQAQIAENRFALRDQQFGPHPRAVEQYCLFCSKELQFFAGAIDKTFVEVHGLPVWPQEPVLWDVCEFADLCVTLSTDLTDYPTAEYVAWIAQRLVWDHVNGIDDDLENYPLQAPGSLLSDRNSCMCLRCCCRRVRAYRLWESKQAMGLEQGQTPRPDRDLDPSSQESCASDQQEVVDRGRAAGGQHQHVAITMSQEPEQGMPSAFAHVQPPSGGSFRAQDQQFPLDSTMAAIRQRIQDDLDRQRQRRGRSAAGARRGQPFPHTALPNGAANANFLPDRNTADGAISFLQPPPSALPQDLVARNDRLFREGAHQNSSPDGKYVVVSGPPGPDTTPPATGIGWDDMTTRQPPPDDIAIEGARDGAAVAIANGGETAAVAPHAHQQTQDATTPHDIPEGVWGPDTVFVEEEDVDGEEGYDNYPDPLDSLPPPSASYDGKLVLVTRQTTPFEHLATERVFSDTLLFLKFLLEELGLEPSTEHLESMDDFHELNQITLQM